VWRHPAHARHFASDSPCQTADDNTWVQVGDVFPVDDLVGGWIATMLLAFNDIAFVHRHLDLSYGDRPAYEYLYFLRLAVGYFNEAATHLSRTENDPEVAAYVASVDDEAQELYADSRTAGSRLRASGARCVRRRFGRHSRPRSSQHRCERRCSKDGRADLLQIVLRLREDVADPARRKCGELKEQRLRPPECLKRDEQLVRRVDRARD
jgi:hypothetical protein